MNKIKVIQYGLGPIGNKTTQYLIEKGKFEIVGAIDIDLLKIGKDVGELAGLEKIGVNVTNDAEKLFKEVKADVVVLTTASSMKKVTPQIIQILNYGLPVVSTCEELSYSWLTEPGLSEEIDKKAKEKNAAVLATGVNPGFLMDFLPVALTGVCKSVSSVRVERYQNAFYRRLPFQQKVGTGLTVEQFMQKVNEGTLRHVGLTESMHMIAARLGWKLDKTEDIINPVIAEEKITAGEIVIEKGNSLGVEQIGRGYKDGKALVTLIFKATIGEENPRDRIVIEGEPSIDSTINGGVNGDIATCAITVNAIPNVINAKPGLRTMADIEPVSCYQ